MRRSHRFALSALCSLAVLVAAGRLATRTPSRADAAREASIASAPRDGARVATTAAAATQQGVTAMARDGAVAVAEGARITTLAAHSESARDLAQRDADAASPEPIVLEDPQSALGSAVAIHGRDPGGPRAIELWRLVGSRAARIATGRSRSDGTLELPALVLPAGDVLLVASPRGAGPRSAAASEPVHASRDPHAPRLIAREQTLDASGAGVLLSLRVEAAEPGGDLIVARTIAAVDVEPARQVEIAREAVVTGADGARATLDLVIAIEAGDTEVLVAQELSDGRRSPWRPVLLDFNPKENEDADAAAEDYAF